MINEDETSSVQADSQRTMDFHPHAQQFDETGVKDFFMPISEVSTDSFFTEFLARTTSRLREAGIDDNRTAEALWLALIYMALEATNCFVITKVSEACRERGVLPTFGSEKNLLTSISRGQVINSTIAERIMGMQLKRSEFLTWGRFIRSILRRDNYSRKPPFLINKQHDILCFSADPWHQRLAAESGHKLLVSNRENWFETLDTIKIDTISLNRKLVSDIVDITETVFVDNGVPMRPNVRQSLFAIFSSLANVTAALLVSVEQQRRYIPREFWSNSMGNIHGRIMAHIVHKEGGRVTVFDHGTGCGWMDSPEVAALEWNYCDRFVCLSDAHTKSIRQLIGRGQKYQINAGSCEVITSPIPLYDCSIANINQRQNRGKSLLVWYLAPIYTSQRHYIPPLPPDIVSVDFQARLLNQLHTLGHKIAVKPHPDCSIGFPDQLLKSVNAKLETRPFETIAHKPDVVVLDYPSSTTFRSTILANIPLVILDPGRITFSPDAKTLLAKRAEIIEIERDGENRRRISTSRLDNAIMRSLHLTDDAFQKTYYPIVEQTSNSFS